MSFTSSNPATGAVLAEHAAHSADEIDAVLRSAAEAQRQWAKVPVPERCDRLARLAECLRADADALAALITAEMGKPITQARAEIEKCAVTAEHFAARSAEWLAPEPVATGARESFVAFEPLGVVLAVMPWNFPFWQVIRCAVPALAAGNAVVLKHAGNVTGCALALERVFREAGFRRSLFRVLRVPGAEMEAVIRHPAVAAVSLTGSTAAGRSVAAAAGAALKKAVLELGGSDPYVVLADADLDLAARVCAESRLTNSGQSCVAAKRFIAVASTAPAFTQKLVERMATAAAGDPTDPATTVGPLARPDLREELHLQVTESIGRGARLLLGGEVPPGPGAFYPPTVLGDVADGMPVWDEETFGPVAAVATARDEAHAIELANRSRFGLGAAVFSRDVARARRIAEKELQAGACFVNTAVKSDPRLPFGGVKESGHGRELAAFGLREFVNVKSVWVA